MELDAYGLQRETQRDQCWKHIDLQHEVQRVQLSDHSHSGSARDQSGYYKCDIQRNRRRRSTRSFVKASGVMMQSS